MTEHTPTPWFVSGVRFRMNGCEWHSINRYDESTKKDENIACVGYDPHTGLGMADAAFIVKVVNHHDTMVEALKQSRDRLLWIQDVRDGKTSGLPQVRACIEHIDAILDAVWEE